MDAQPVPETQAAELLRLVLPDKQWTEFQETDAVEVVGSRGIYRIRTHGTTAILNPNSRQQFATGCLQLSIAAPPADRVIAEFVLIRNAEALYWKTANIFSAPVHETAVLLLTLLDTILMFICVLRILG